MVDGLREGDLVLYDLLADEEFADQALELLAVPLVAYARPILISWTGSGQIYLECSGHGRPLHPSDDERDHLRRHRDEAEDLVADALAMGLRLLQANALAGVQKWSRAGDASLATYYVTACVLTFPTPFRRWSREFRRRPVPTPADDGAFSRLSAPDDTESLVLSEIDARKRLDTMPPQVRTIVELKIAGLTHSRIAERLGMPSGRAVEGVLRRYRISLDGDGGDW